MFVYFVPCGVGDLVVLLGVDGEGAVGVLGDTVGVAVLGGF